MWWRSFFSFPPACPGFHPPRRVSVEQREQEAERLTKEAAGLRRKASLLKAELEARGEALRQVMKGVRMGGYFYFFYCFSCLQYFCVCYAFGAVERFA